MLGSSRLGSNYWFLVPNGTSVVARILLGVLGAHVTMPTPAKRRTCRTTFILRRSCVVLSFATPVEIPNLVIKHLRSVNLPDM
jgi:hypothetical protein